MYLIVIVFSHLDAHQGQGFHKKHRYIKNENLR